MISFIQISHHFSVYGNIVTYYAKHSVKSMRHGKFMCQDPPMGYVDLIPPSFAHCSAKS